MSDIDLLRRAAALMRERAQAADPHGWESLGWESDDALGPLSTGTVKDAQHIASWHPAVALAVADWLERSADHYAPWPDHAADCKCKVDALATARAYLNEPPETYAERLARQGDE